MKKSIKIDYMKLLEKWPRNPCRFCGFMEVYIYLHGTSPEVAITYCNHCKNNSTPICYKGVNLNRPLFMVKSLQRWNNENPLKNK